MLPKLHTFSRLGIEAIPVDVEVDVSAAAMPKTILVGLPEAAVRFKAGATPLLAGIWRSGAKTVSSRHESVHEVTDLLHLATGWPENVTFSSLLSLPQEVAWPLGPSGNCYCRSDTILRVSSRIPNARWQHVGKLQRV